MSKTIEVYGNFVIDQIMIGGRKQTRIGGGVYYSVLPLLSRHKLVIKTNYSPKILPYIPHTHLNLIQPLHYSASTNIFTLIYKNHSRVIKVVEQAPILPYEAGVEHDNAPTLLNPVLGEIQYPLLKNLDTSAGLIIADLQGFVRKVRSGAIIPHYSLKRLEMLLKYIDILHMSDEELFGLKTTSINELLHDLQKITARKSSTIVITRGVNDPIVIGEGGILSIETNTQECINVKDTTGAGDYFTGSLLKYILSGHDIITACRLSHIDTCSWLRIREEVPHRSAPPHHHRHNTSPLGPTI